MSGTHTTTPMASNRHPKTDRQTDNMTSDTLGVCFTHLYYENQHIYICPLRFGIQRVFIRQFFNHYSFCNHPCRMLPVAACQDLHIHINHLSIVVHTAQHVPASMSLPLLSHFSMCSFVLSYELRPVCPLYCFVSIRWHSTHSTR